MTYRVHYTRRGARSHVDLETYTDARVFLTWGHAAGAFYDPRIERVD